MTTPGYLSNAELAAKLSTFVDRWDLRENQMIALISQPNGTVIVTDGLGNEHTLSSFPQLQQDVTALLNQLSGGISNVDAIIDGVEAHATSAQASANTANAAKNAANASKVAAANSASAASTSATAASAAANDATAAQTAAQSSKTAAASSATSAATSATSASTAASNAQNAKAGAETARDAAQGYASQAQTIVDSAGNVVSVAGKTGVVLLAIGDIGNLQTALNEKIKKSGDRSLVLRGTATANPGVWLNDLTNKTQGVLFFDKNNNRITLTIYDPAITDSNVTLGYVCLRADGSFFSLKPITSPQGLVGNASSASKLINAKTINGTVFDGTAAITTQQWGAQRSLKIGNKSHTVNGSANITWTLGDIGAAPVSHTHTSADIVDVHRARRYFFSQI